ncbi:MAG TPA: MFS transporter [Acidobacteriaceae bacterium]|nr:MFS transporter [Acidobacteriaceae bacterium]
MLPARTRPPRFSLLCFGFVVCGIVTVLPGPLLPVLATRWHLRDVQSGGFFAVEFAASTVAAILSPWRLRGSLPLGFGFMAAAVGLLMIAWGPVSAPTGHALALAAFALIGLGIGLSVTATNLTVALSSGASFGASARARRLSVVNLWWGIGAVVCPWLIATAERTGHLRALLPWLALAAGASFAALLPLRLSDAGTREPPKRAPSATQTGTLVYFALFLFLYVGVENTVGGWIATYAHRFTGMTLAAASLTVSVYWLALLAGRGLGSLALRPLSERAVLLSGLALALVAVALLVLPHAPRVVLAAVALAGAGFGPVFPLGVSRMMARVSDHRPTGWVFAMCAGGGAVLPWLTGLVSTGSGSLRVGFAIPVAALAVILALALSENAVLRKPVSAPAAKQEV